MNTPELKETDYLKAWVLFFVSATIGGALAGAVVGGILGGILGSAGIPLMTITTICAIAGAIVSLPISYFCFRFFVSYFIVRKLTTNKVSNESSAVT